MTKFTPRMVNLGPMLDQKWSEFREPKLSLTDCYFYTEKRKRTMKSGKSITVISLSGDKATVRGTGFDSPESLCKTFNQTFQVNGKTWSVAAQLPTDTQDTVLVLKAGGNDHDK